MLYGCYRHEKDHAQYDLCDLCVFKGNNMFLVGQVSGLIENFNIGHRDFFFFRHHKHDKCHTLHDGTIH